MYAIYHLKADELNHDVVQSLKKPIGMMKSLFCPKERRNSEYTSKLHRRIKRLDEGKGIVKTMAELRAMENA